MSERERLRALVLGGDKGAAWALAREAVRTESVGDLAIAADSLGMESIIDAHVGMVSGVIQTLSEAMKGLSAGRFTLPGAQPDPHITIINNGLETSEDTARSAVRSIIAERAERAAAQARARDCQCEQCQAARRNNDDSET